MKRLTAFTRLLFTFLSEFLQANLTVLYISLFKSPDKLNSHLVTYPTPELTPKERLFLAQLITLTPGTIACVIDDENQSLLLHLLDAENPNQVLEHIDRVFKTRLLEVTR